MWIEELPPASCLGGSPLRLQSDDGVGVALKQRTDQLFKLLPRINVPINKDFVFVQTSEVQTHPVN